MRTMHSVLKRGGLYWDRDLLPVEGYQARYKRLQAAVAASGDEAWLFFGDVERHGNVVYATNFMPRVRSALAFVPKSGAPVLLANIGLRDVPAAKTITWVDDIRPFGRLPKDLIALLEEKGLSRSPIGVCGFDDQLPVVDWSAIEKGLPLVRWNNRDAEVKVLRAAKEPWEIETIRRAGSMGDRALAFAPSVLRAGTTMRQAIAAIDLKVRELGAEDAHYLIASGPQTGVSLRPVDDRVLASGDTVIISMMVQFQRYWSETARTFVLGKASPALSELHKSAVITLDVLRGGVRAGLDTTAIVAAAEKAVENPALARTAAAYGFGHGIGLDIEEGPQLANDKTSGKNSIPSQATLALRTILHSNGQGVAVAQTVLTQTNDVMSLNGAPALVEIPA
jgi:Xaa-Pro aminopeptidase